MKISTSGVAPWNSNGTSVFPMLPRPIHILSLAIKALVEKVTFSWARVYQRFQRHLHRLPVAASGHGYVLGGLAECQMSTNWQHRQQVPLRGGNLHEQCKKPRAVSNTGQSIKTKPIKPIRNPENAAAATTPAMTALRVTTRACWSTINDSRLDKCRVPRSIGESLESNN